MEKCKVFVMIYNSKFHLNVYYFNYIITEIWQMQFLRMAWNETFIHIIYTYNILQQYIQEILKHLNVKQLSTYSYMCM